VQDPLRGPMRGWFDSRWPPHQHPTLARVGFWFPNTTIAKYNG
jgi:hypothetical protein